MESEYVFVMKISSTFGRERVFAQGKVSLISLVVNVGADGVEADRKSTRLNSSHSGESRMPSSA